MAACEEHGAILRGGVSLLKKRGSPCTARKLLHIFEKSLRAQLQPFDHGQVREQLISQILHRHAVADGEHRRLDHPGRFGIDLGGAELLEERILPQTSPLRNTNLLEVR